MWEASFRLEKAKQPSFKFGICSIRGSWLQVPSFPELAPACAAVRFGLLLSTLSRLTHTQFLDGSNSQARGAHRLANLMMAGSHFAGGQGNTKARSCRRVGAGNLQTLLEGNDKISDRSLSDGYPANRESGERKLGISGSAPGPFVLACSPLQSKV
jgi:hypothetical protein